MRYLIIIEPTETGYSAYAPDLPGCVATGHSVADVEKNMREAMEFHLEGLHENGRAYPQAQVFAEYLEIAA